MDFVITNPTQASYIRTLSEYHTKWINCTHGVEDIMGLFGIEDIANIEECVQSEKKIIFRLHKALFENELLKEKDIADQFNAICVRIHFGYQIIQQTQYFKNHPSQIPSLFMHNPIEYEKLNPFQKLLYFIYDHFESMKYRKFGDCCYEEIHNPHPTKAWKIVGKIIDIVNQQFGMLNNYNNWLLFTTSKDMDKRIVDYLIRSEDNRFPTLKKHRNIFSFNNGIYISYVRSTSSDCFIRYDSPRYMQLDNTYIACRYFDKPFSDSTETPILDSIYRYQNLSDDVIAVNKMFLGRMLYKTGQLDNWQVIMMLIGCGGTGKSTINNIVRLFYEPEDVGIMGNNHQKIFGLADIYDKFAFIAPEIKRDWNIDQAEFQEIVSGGKININIKHKSSVMVQWTAPGMLGGNENPGFIDNASSIQRRVVVTRFDRKVDDVITDLNVKLENEISEILKSCNLQYLKYVSSNQHTDIWKWLPRYFLETQKIMASASNALHAFLDSSLLTISEICYIPMSLFFKQFNEFCKENNFSKPKINVDFYRSPFAKFKVKVVMRDKMRYAGRMYKNESILFGVDLVSNQSIDDEYYQVV
jgi:hypothetical protein